MYTIDMDSINEVVDGLSSVYNEIIPPKNNHKKLTEIINKYEKLGCSRIHKFTEKATGKLVELLIDAGGMTENEEIGAGNIVFVFDFYTDEDMLEHFGDEYNGLKTSEDWDKLRDDLPLWLSDDCMNFIHNENW